MVNKLARQVWEELRQLGSTADEVAERLRQRGHCGVPGDSGFCPLHAYLVSLHPLWGIDVGAEVVTVFWKAPDWDGLAEAGDYSTVDVPPGCSRFVDRFDGGAYKDLELTREALPVPRQLGGSHRGGQS